MHSDVLLQQLKDVLAILGADANKNLALCRKLKKISQGLESLSTDERFIKEKITQYSSELEIFLSNLRNDKYDSLLQQLKEIKESCTVEFATASASSTFFNQTSTKQTLVSH